MQWSAAPSAIYSIRDYPSINVVPSLKNKNILNLWFDWTLLLVHYAMQKNVC